MRCVWHCIPGTRSPPVPAPEDESAAETAAPEPAPGPVFQDVYLLRMNEFASRAAGGSISVFLCRRETTDRHYQRRRLTTTFIKQLITTNNLIHKHLTSGRSNPQLHAQCIPHSTLLLPPAGTPVHSTHAAWTPSHTCSLAGFSLTVFYKYYTTSHN